MIEDIHFYNTQIFNSHCFDGPYSESPLLPVFALKTGWYSLNVLLTSYDHLGGESIINKVLVLF
jgi:hypothetical protein